MNDDKGAFVLIERTASGAQETGMTAYLYTDRSAAADSARGFPMSQEDAARQGQTTWAEVHPVTGYFAENFETMQEAGRLDSMAALYSTAKEIDGHLAPAHPDEPGAITGQLRENDAGDGNPYANGPSRDKATDARLSHEIYPSLMPTITGTEFYTEVRNDTRAMPVAAPTNENEAPALPVEIEARTLDPMAERGTNHYAVLKAETPEAGEQMADQLATVAESRDVDGGAPSLREIVNRQADESTARQGAELDASQGVAAADRPMTADEIDAAYMKRVEAEMLKREERDDTEPMQEHSPARSAAGPSMV